MSDETTNDNSNVIEIDLSSKNFVKEYKGQELFQREALEGIMTKFEETTEWVNKQLSWLG